MKVFICLFAAVAAVSAAWMGDYPSGHGGFIKPGLGFAKVPVVKVAGFGGYGAGVHGAGFVAGPKFVKSAGPVASFGGYGGDFKLKQKYAGAGPSGFGNHLAPIAAYGPGVVKAPIGPVVLKTAAVPVGPVAYGKFGPAGLAHGGHWKKH